MIATFSPSESAAADEPITAQVTRGELVAYPGPWGFLPRAHIILVTDVELETLAHQPDQEINLATTFNQRVESLRQICQRAQKRGIQTLILAFDQFFAQYRPGQHKPRRLTPDRPETIGLIAKISKFAQAYGLGLELSLLSPLEIGPAYSRETGETGQWMHYRKGLRDPTTGTFSVQLWQQRHWTNNKGPIDITDAGVRVFAFREQRLSGTPYRVVDPQQIVEITEGIQVELWPGSTTPVARRIRVHGTGQTDLGPLDRVLVVQLYRTPEMDYFSPRAAPYLRQLIDRYADAGVRLHGLYADEMHIQQDWAYHGHHDHGEFALRYMSAGLANAYADRYGEEYRDFAKWLVYFIHGQEDFAADLSAKSDAMQVLGAAPAAIRKTALLRARYYHLLQDGVVDLFAGARRHAEQRMGHRLAARAHATWAESPTIDRWNYGRQPAQLGKYEYTSAFLWSATVHQAAAACYDYFKWGDFLTGNGNDHAEGGWLDRNYYALALACSTGILNEVPHSYAAHWGMPAAIHRRRASLASAYGTSGAPLGGVVQQRQHRDVEVLMLYPLDLVAADERFGSWMTQYGYANYVPQTQLIERGRVADGAIEMAGRRFTTLVALFEPFPKARLLEMIGQLADSGGRVIWSGPPPVLTWEGADALVSWQKIFGLDYTPQLNEGIRAPGKQVRFEGPLAPVAPQRILTDYLVDRIYPVTPHAGTVPVARLMDQVVGTHRAGERGGSATFLGYRPRDDQSGSLGYETRNWFEVLRAVGAYPATGRFEGINDNPQVVSRTTDTLACQFPNGAVAIARHFRRYQENWPGGFARKAEEDRAFVAAHPLPDDRLALDGLQVAGHEVRYHGGQVVVLRVDAQGCLIALAAIDARKITVDGRTFEFAEKPLPRIVWGPVANERQVPGGAVFQLQVHGTGSVRIPRGNLPQRMEIVAEGPTPGSRGPVVPSRWEDDTLVLNITGQQSGRQLWGVPLP